MKSNHGTTLVELLITLAVMTIASVVVIPLFSSIQSEARAKSKINEIASAIRLARNHAINLGVSVSVCPLMDNCCSSNWQTGFSVFTNSGDKACFDGNDELITLFPSINNGDILTYNRASLRFLPDGLASGYNGTFRYCPDSTKSPHSKAVIISNAGRSRISTDNVSCE